MGIGEGWGLWLWGGDIVKCVFMERGDGGESSVRGVGGGWVGVVIGIILLGLAVNGINECGLAEWLVLWYYAFSRTCQNTHVKISILTYLTIKESLQCDALFPKLFKKQLHSLVSNIKTFLICRTIYKVYVEDVELSLVQIVRKKICQLHLVRLT